LVPVALVTVLAWERSRPWRALARLVRIGGVVYAALVIGYLPVARLWPPHAFVHSDLTTLFGGDGVLARGMGALLREAPLPHTFLEGVVYTALLGRHGQLAFLHGQWRTHGWWYYFPLAFVLKYPPPFVLMGAAGLLSLLRFPTVPRARKIALSLPPLV